MYRVPIRPWMVIGNNTILICRGNCQKYTTPLRILTFLDIFKVYRVPIRPWMIIASNTISICHGNCQKYTTPLRKLNIFITLVYIDKHQCNFIAIEYLYAPGWS